MNNFETDDIYPFSVQYAPGGRWAVYDLVGDLKSLAVVDTYEEGVERAKELRKAKENENGQ